MFGWWKKESGPTADELREAYLKRLADVVRRPEKPPVPCVALCQVVAGPTSSPDPVPDFAGPA